MLSYVYTKEKFLKCWDDHLHPHNVRLIDWKNRIPIKDIILTLSKFQQGQQKTLEENKACVPDILLLLLFSSF